MGTKSQQALKLQREQSRTERKVSEREQKEAEQLRKFALKQQKEERKHRADELPLFSAHDLLTIHQKTECIVRSMDIVNENEYHPILYLYEH